MANPPPSMSAIVLGSGVVLREFLADICREVAEECIHEEKDEKRTALEEMEAFLTGLDADFFEQDDNIPMEIADEAPKEPEKIAAPAVITVPTLKRKLAEAALEEEPDDAVYRNYVKAQRNGNTSKKTKSVRNTLGHCCLF